MFRIALAFLLIALPLAGPAQQTDPAQEAGPVQQADPAMAKFRLRGDTLVYDTETGVEGGEAEITNGDVDRLLRLLRDTGNVKVLELNSAGGSVYASEQMARIVLDFKLDTVVSGSCVSSCVDIFLAGKARRMLLGSRIGFHQRGWPPAAIERYYEDQRDMRGWATPFEFAAWLYADTQAETYHHLTYMLSRGVDPAFAIRTKSVTNDDEWYPTRLELFKAGVLTD